MNEADAVSYHSDCMNCRVAGSCPLHRTVVRVMAKSPRSLLPACCSMCICCTTLDQLNCMEKICDDSFQGCGKVKMKAVMDFA